MSGGNVIVKNPLILGGGEAKFTEYNGGVYLKSNGNDYYYLINFINNQFNISSEAQEIARYACAYRNLHPNYTNISIPYNIKKIGEYSFYESNISSVDFENTDVQLDRNAFAYCRSLTSISNMPDLTKLNYGVFEWCNLSSISIPDSVEELDGYCFAGNQNLSVISGANNLRRIGGGSFYECSSLTSLDFLRDNSSLTDINDSAFSGSGLAGNLNIPSTVTSIGSYAFGNTAITGVSLPASVDNMSWGNPFQKCPSLSRISVDPNNARYYTLNNDKMLLEKNSRYDYDLGEEIHYSTIRSAIEFSSIEGGDNVTTLGSGCLVYIQNHNSWGTAFSIPEGIVNYEGSALSPDGDYSYYYNVILPNSFEGPVKSWDSNLIGSSANIRLKWRDPFNCNYRIVKRGTFYLLGSGSEIELPATITDIEEYAFHNVYCNAISYAGTVNDWYNINIDSGWRWDTNITTVHCSDGDITL